MKWNKKYSHSFWSSKIGCKFQYSPHVLLTSCAPPACTRFSMVIDVFHIDRSMSTEYRRGLEANCTVPFPDEGLIIRWLWMVDLSGVDISYLNMCPRRHCGKWNLYSGHHTFNRINFARQLDRKTVNAAVSKPVKRRSFEYGQPPGFKDVCSWSKVQDHIMTRSIPSRSFRSRGYTEERILTPNLSVNPLWIKMPSQSSMFQCFHWTWCSSQVQSRWQAIARMWTRSCLMSRGDFVKWHVQQRYINKQSVQQHSLWWDSFLFQRKVLTLQRPFQRIFHREILFTDIKDPSFSLLVLTLQTRRELKTD